MELKKEIEFNKYKNRGSLHWREMTSNDIRVFNLYQEARYGWILRTLGDIRGKKILDLGSGDGSFAYVLAKKGAEVIGIDNEEKGVGFARENLESVDSEKKLKYQFMVGSAYELPFEVDTFDAVVCCDVIEHLQDPEKMLSEAQRILKKGGTFVLTTPYRITEIPQDVNHVKEYYPKQLQEMLGTFFVNPQALATHHMLWRSLYVHAFHFFGKRSVGRWCMNLFYFVFRVNPFMFTYEKPTKFDAFTNICAWGIK